VSPYSNEKRRGYTENRDGPNKKEDRTRSIGEKKVTKGRGDMPKKKSSTKGK